MEEYRESIIRKYRKLAHLPDFLFGFTFPLRRRTIAKLHLTPGGSVLEVGCSSGANFALLEESVGASGEITGIDLSPDMVNQARKRIEKAGWKNVTVIEAAAEEVRLERQYDGVLLFAMQDVLTSPRALDNILNYLKPGGTIAAAGPKLPSGFPGKILRPFIRVVFNRFAVTKADQDKPWRLLAERVKRLEVEEDGMGISYFAYGNHKKNGESSNRC